ncbi:hypothetical protein GBAR_LOCUS4298 [Geodia barretti]|uniref:Uncharacterized protein n=1 Tax=Geodia barretti TaxID=519541 RepID=A0AA35R669_GEOBA|nr:hypothetical protein GBAR_LOCUS4298 [Geodia barretti]
MTMAGSREPGKKATPRNWTMFGWRRVLISWHSSKNSRWSPRSESLHGSFWRRRWLQARPPPPRCHRLRRRFRCQ